MPLTSTAAPSFVTRAVRASVAGFLCLAAIAGLSSGCLDRPVAEQSPRTSDIFIDQLVQTAIDKIDLLFMIDNSISMADKQITLQAAVPQLVDRLVTPICVLPDGTPHATAKSDSMGMGCPTGYLAEFKPILNIHIGIVSSSLGAHGGSICSETTSMTPPPPTNQDNGHLIGDALTTAARPGVNMPPTFNNLGFLAWGPMIPGAEANAQTLKANFQSLVVATGEKGCGYEASLEAWYRFLIDPNPPLTVTNQGNQAVLADLDQQIIDQRAAFLRPDSLVAIIMLTDENDCSVADYDGGIGFLVSGGGGAQMSKGTSACNNDPNHECCRLCIVAGTPPAGCTDVEQDPNCRPNKYHDDANDDVNLKCFDQKRRFGYNFLWPTDRYVVGLTQATLPDYRSSDPKAPELQNPLFEASGGKAARSRDLVFLAGIIGVPWQDIATEDTLMTANQLKYMKYQELVENDRWLDILGNPATGAGPRDPLMRESVDERTGTSPHVMPGALVGSGSNSPQENPINGHEADYTSDRKDLQYACIYPLAGARPCATGAGSACDCKDTDVPFKRPLCQPPGGGPVGTTQYYAKAYPGVRHLQVLKDFGAATTGGNSIVASICPKIQNVNDPAGGYNPAVAAIIDRLKEALKGKCLNRPLNVDPVTKEVPCAIVEAIAAGSCLSDGQPPGLCASARGRLPVGPELIGPVRQRLSDTHVCGPNTGTSCSEYCMCAIAPLAPGPALDACQTLPAESTTDYGYCYIDPLPAPFGQEIGNRQLVDPPICLPSEPRRLRFSGLDTPANGSVTFFACLGAPVVPEGL